LFKTLRNAFALPDIRKKLLYVVFIVIIYRIGCAIPVPFLSATQMSLFSEYYSNSAIELMSLMAGSAFAQANLFALSISPYINSSIIMQLLCTAIPALERMSKEEDGRKKITQITRVVTVAIAIVTSFGYYQMLKASGVLTRTDWFAALVMIACYTAGSSLVMWLGEKINENGIGNGISIILFVNIVAGLPTGVYSMITSLIMCIKGTQTVQGFEQAIPTADRVAGIVSPILTLLLVVAMTVFIIFITHSERRISIQYAKRQVGRKMYGGQSSNLPLKLNMSGVMPVIFANSILALPGTIDMLVNNSAEGFWAKFFALFSPTSWVYAVLFLILIIAFSYFYIAISFNPIEVANNLKNQGGSIPGLRPGKPTSDYITKVLNKVTLMGAFFLAIIAVLPLVVNLIFTAASSGVSLGSVAFAGTSVIIVVGVALETYREIESQMTMRHYKGFLE